MPFKFAAVAALAASCLAFAAPAPAVADLAEADSRFLTTLRSLGWTIYNPDGLTSQAHMVCNEGLEHGVSWHEMHSLLTKRDGYSSVDASTLIATAIRVYCPKYAEVIDDISPKSADGQTGEGRAVSPVQAAGPDDVFLKQLAAKGVKIGGEVSAERAIKIGRQQCCCSFLKSRPLRVPQC